MLFNAFAFLFAAVSAYYSAWVLKDPFIPRWLRALFWIPVACAALQLAVFLTRALS